MPEQPTELIKEEAAHGRSPPRCSQGVIGGRANAQEHFTLAIVIARLSSVVRGGAEQGYGQCVRLDAQWRAAEAS